MKTLPIIILVIAILSINNAYSKRTANFIKISKHEFKTSDVGFEDAWNNLREGDFWFTEGEQFHTKALDYYLKANMYNPNNAELNYKIGICYLHSDKKSNAAWYIEKAYHLNSGVSDDIQYFMGQAYHINKQFSKAIDAFRAYSQSLSKREFAQQRPDIEKRLNECYNGIQLINNPLDVNLHQVGTEINSSFPEYAPFISADESIMVFTSRREKTTGNEMDYRDLKFYEDIYISYKKEGRWTTAKNIGIPLNTNYHDATVGLSADGKTIFIYKGLKNNGDIYVSRYENGKWSSPVSISGKINTRFHEPSASITADGNTLYFISNRTDNSFGGHDIFVATRNNAGEWGNIRNVGQRLNTRHDEKGVFITPDGNTIYFSSKGHKTMGGYDIFKSKKDKNGNWTEPENIGYPINTTDDDLYFVVTAHGKNAYFSSVRNNGFGDQDIYQVTFPENNGTEALDFKQLVNNTLLKAEPIPPKVIIASNLQLQHTNRNFGILQHTIQISTLSHKTGISHSVDTTENFIAKNIYFDFDKHTLTANARLELNKLTTYLAQNRNANIIITGHTDNTGCNCYNLSLSEKRSEEVVQYLTSKGIKEERMAMFALSEMQPAATNTTTNGRKMNRRVEIEIIGN